MNDYEIQFAPNTRFLVTGGAGFIGSNIVEKLLKQGCMVNILDNFSTGYEENIKEFLDNKSFRVIKGDIRHIEDCQKACRNIDYVLHQAALGSVPRSIADPSAINNSNVVGTLNMLIAARDNNVKRFVYASSSSVYGDNIAIPKTEENLGNPISPYAVTKLTNELYGRVFFYIYGLPTIGLRYFNVYGKKQNPHTQYAAVIPTFVSKVLNEKVPIINGDGQQSRDFTYIEDVIQANLKACLAERSAFGEVFNIAYGGRTTINDLYAKICTLLDKQLKPVYGPERSGDVSHSKADISKASRILDYNPRFNIDEGLKLSISWYKKAFEVEHENS